MDEPDVTCTDVSTGRPRARDLTDLELKHLRLLLEIKETARAAAQERDVKIEDFVLELREGGCSVRVIGESVGVSYSTVQTWIKHAEQRRG